MFNKEDRGLKGYKPTEYPIKPSNQTMNCIKKLVT